MRELSMEEAVQVCGSAGSEVPLVNRGPKPNGFSSTPDGITSVPDGITQGPDGITQGPNRVVTAA